LRQKKRLVSRPIYKCHVIANVYIMSEPDKFRETLEEHGEQLRLESERISTLVQQVLQLEKIVTNLAKTVDIYGTVLANVHPWFSLLVRRFLEAVVGKIREAQRGAYRLG